MQFIEQTPAQGSSLRAPACLQTHLCIL